MKQYIVKSSKYPAVTVLIDDCDLDFFESRKWSLVANGRYVGESKKTRHRLHRLLLNPGPKEIVDHINGNAFDNRRCNLRVVSHKQNNRNSKCRDNTTSKFKGVYRNKYGNWVAQIYIDGVRTHIGIFKVEKDAALAYNTLAKSHWGEYAKLNIL